MSGYVKIFTSILDSTVWRESDATRLVWITLLAMANKYGIVETSIPGLADRARVTLPQCEEALAALKAPDRYSRSTAYEGRRIESVEGGFRLLNYAHYRDKLSLEERREYKREWDRRNRPMRRNPRDKTESDSFRQTPTPSDSSPTDPTYTSASATSSSGRVSKGNEQAEHFPEIPPMSRKDFDELCEVRGIPNDCRDWFWNTHDARNWVDATGQPIRKVEPLLLNTWKTWAKGGRPNDRAPRSKPDHSKGF